MGGIRSAPAPEDPMTSLLVIRSAQIPNTIYAKNLQCRSTRLILLTPLRLDYTHGQKSFYITLLLHDIWKIFEEELLNHPEEITFNQMVRKLLLHF